MNSLKLSERGRAHLIDVEGLRLRAYDDATGKEIKDWSAVRGNPTIGVGHLLTAQERQSKLIKINGVQVRWRMGLTGTQVHELLSQDLRRFENAINQMVKVPLSQHVAV